MLAHEAKYRSLNEYSTLLAVRWSAISSGVVLSTVRSLDFGGRVPSAYFVRMDDVLCLVLLTLSRAGQYFSMVRKACLGIVEEFPFDLGDW